jgi:hypothetical protein
MPFRSVSAAYLAHAADLAGNPGQQAAFDSSGHWPGCGPKTCGRRAAPPASPIAKNAHVS